MKELRHYLSEAKDYEEGHLAVEQLISIYNHNPQKAEAMWKDALSTYSQLEVFKNTLDQKGLFVQYEKKSKFNIFCFASNEVEKIEFALRIYSYNSQNDRVAVLKIVHS